MRNSNNSPIACPAQVGGSCQTARHLPCPSSLIGRPVSRRVHRHRRLSLSPLRPPIYHVDDGRCERHARVAVVIASYAGAYTRASDSTVSLVSSIFHYYYVSPGAISCTTHGTHRMCQPPVFRPADCFDNLYI